MSDSEELVGLSGYTDFKKMMQYRLDKETAMVFVSAVTRGPPGFASESCVVSVEHMQKVSKDETAAVKLTRLPTGHSEGSVNANDWEPGFFLVGHQF